MRHACKHRLTFSLWVTRSPLHRRGLTTECLGLKYTTAKRTEKLVCKYIQYLHTSVCIISLSVTERYFSNTSILSWYNWLHNWIWWGGTSLSCCSFYHCRINPNMYPSDHEGNPRAPGGIPQRTETKGTNPRPSCREASALTATPPRRYRRSEDG